MHRTDESHDKRLRPWTSPFVKPSLPNDGTLPRTLERFLATRGSCAAWLTTSSTRRRDRAIGRMRTLIAGLFDGAGVILSRMLDPRRTDSLRQGVLDTVLAIEANAAGGATGRAEVA
ncbi:MAG TPA: hypothetical protein VND54_00405 [Candidatus Saccharimonadales bacterium]|nr:hypothetical protein [Candidatus Saccharimonadales bacterium]